MVAELLALAIGLEAPTGPEVTVYNQGFGLVKEVRTFSLKPGRQEVLIQGIAAQIETNSVGIQSLSPVDAFSVIEQNYRYDLISPESVLAKMVGSRIKLRRVLPDGSKETVEGVLVSLPSSGLVVKTGDGSVLLSPSGEIEVSSIPAGLISRPTLVWDVVAHHPGPTKTSITYLTKGMSWNADYVLTLGGKGLAGLRGWVTMTNSSGTTYAGARLKLLAGDVHRVEPPMAPMGYARSVAKEALADKGFAEETLFEYHLYTLQRPATLRNNEIKQLSLLEGDGVRYTRKLILDSLRNYGTYYPSEGQVATGRMTPQVRVEFVNSKENGLGMPLPKGNVKVYQRDASGSMQMLGEDQIDHTPKNERLSLVVRRAFDIIGERTRTSLQRLGPRSYRETFRVELRNRKAEADRVYVIERHYGDWRVGKTSMPFTKLDATTMQYVVDLKAGETRQVVYTVDTRW